MESITNFLNAQNFKLNSQHEQLFMNYVEQVNFKKNDTIILEGEQSNFLYYIISGIVRGYYIDKNGSEKTKCFSSENEFFCTEGLRTNREATFSIQCIEDVTCLKIPYKIIDRICCESLQVDNFVKHCYTLQVTKLENRQKTLLINDATERYDWFCETFPTLHSRLPLMYIASYIGIHCASLSRIRKNK